MSNSKILIGTNIKDEDHKKQIKDCFSDLEIEINDELRQKSIDDATKTIILFLTSTLLQGYFYDLMKPAIQRPFNKFKSESIKLILRFNGINFVVQKDGKVKPIVVPDRQKEFEDIDTLKDLFEYFKKNNNIKQGWKKVKLGNIVDKISNNFNPKKEGREKYIGLEHIEPNTLKLAGYGYSNDTKSTKKKFKKGDVLFGKMRPYFRKVIQANFNGVCSGEILVLKSQDDLFQKYLFYMVANQKFIDKVNKTTGGVDRPRAKWKTMKEFEMQIPKSIQTQKKIASVLSKYDDLIENNTRRIEILEQMAQSIYKDWFVNYNFPGHEDVDFVDSGTEFGQIPEGWEVKKVKEEIKLSGGFSFKSSMYDNKGKFGIVKIRNIKNGKFDPNCKDYIKALPEKIKDHQILKDGDMLMSLTGNVGRVCLVYGKNYLLNQRIAKIIPNNNYDYSFSYCLFRSNYLFNKMNLIATGVAQQNLSSIKTKNLKVIFPNVELRKKFNQKVKIILDEIINLRLQNKNLKQTRDVLFPKLMSGELEVEDLDIKI